MYLGTGEISHKGDGILFHFTRYDKFLKIIEDLTLLPSEFEKLNDLNEGNIHNMNMNKAFLSMYTAHKYIREKCRVLCFSQNYDKDGFGFRGTNHPAMWAHYAENSEGVCIAINKDDFLDKNKAIFATIPFYKFEDVRYSMFNTPREDKIDYVDAPEEFIKRNWEGLFFLKHEDWKNEDEHRLFIMDYDGKFSIDGCVEYIVLGRKFYMNEAKIKELMDRVVNPESVCYKKFKPHDFASIAYDTSGYRTFDISSKICEIVKKNMRCNPLYQEYHDWLCKEYDMNF